MLSFAGFQSCLSVWNLQLLKLLVEVIKVVFVFLWRLLSVAQLFSALRRVASRCINTSSTDEHVHMPGMKSIDKDSTAPCLERLRRLEQAVMELNLRSPRIPPEKEDLIEESMRRIRSIESDIQKTQRVSDFIWNLTEMSYTRLWECRMHSQKIYMVWHSLWKMGAKACKDMNSICRVTSRDFKEYNDFLSGDLL